MEVRRDQLEKLYFLQATVSEGLPTFSLAAGTPITDILFKLVQRDEQILMVVPNFRFQANPNTPIARSVRRSFADAFLEAFKIEAKSDEGKRLLIDVSNLFRSDLIQIQQIVSLAAGGSYSIDREKTVYNQVKAFPNNLFIQTAYHFAGGQQRGGGGWRAFWADWQAQRTSLTHAACPSRSTITCGSCPSTTGIRRASMTRASATS
jgi:plasmid replication initiation protein